MRVYTKHIKVLGLAPHELEMVMQMVQEAKDGKIVHYAERQTAPGEYFGISVDAQYEYKPMAKRVER